MPNLRSIVAAAVSSTWSAGIIGVDAAPPVLLLTVSTAAVEELITAGERDAILEAAREAGLQVDRLGFQVSERSQIAAAAPPAVLEKTDQAPERDLWAKVPLTVLSDPRLTPNAKLVYGSLATFNGYSEKYPAIATIGARCACCDRSVQKGLRELQDLGYLVIDTGGGRGRASRYTLLPAPRKGANCAGFRENPAQSSQKPRRIG